MARRDQHAVLPKLSALSLRLSLLRASVARWSVGRILAWYVWVTALAVVSLLPCGFLSVALATLGGSDRLVVAPLSLPAVVVGAPWFFAAFVADGVSSVCHDPPGSAAIWKAAFCAIMIPISIGLQARAIALWWWRWPAEEIAASVLVGATYASLCVITCYAEMTVVG